MKGIVVSALMDLKNVKVKIVFVMRAGNTYIKCIVETNPL